MATWTLAGGDLPIAGTWVGRDTIIDEFLAGAQSYYVPGSITIEVTGMVAEDDQVVMQWTSRARTRRGQVLRERLHRRVHGRRRTASSMSVNTWTRCTRATSPSTTASDYVQPSPADTSTAVSSIRSTAAGRL